MPYLLYGLLPPSGKDAAVAIAEHVAGSVPAFVELMNEKADELGLRNTHFANPHGLDDADHYTSAHDIAVFGRELLRRPELAEIVGSMEYQPAWDRPAFSNSNRLLFDYPESIGIKIGFTDKAGQTIVAGAGRGGRGSNRPAAGVARAASRRASPAWRRGRDLCLRPPDSRRAPSPAPARTAVWRAPA